MDNNTNNFSELQGFNLAPNPKVWEEIEKQLPEKKKRRIIAWWWVMPALLFMGIGSLFFLNSKMSKSAGVITEVNNMTPNISINKTGENLIQNEKNQAINNGVISENSTSVLNKSEKVLGNSIKYSINDKIISGNSKKGLINSKNALENSTKHLINGKRDSGDAENNLVNSRNVSVNSAIALGISRNASGNSAINLINSTIISQNNALINKENTGKIAKKTPETLQTIKNDEKGVKSIKKWQFSVTALVGINYSSYSNVFGKDDNPPAVTGVGTSTGINPPTYKLTLPQTGYLAGIGAVADYRVSKYSALSIGLQYKFQQNNLLVEAVPQSTMFLPQDLYTAGSKIYRNNYHFLSVPLNYKYCLNPKSSSAISLLLGGSFDYVVSTTSLYINNKAGYYEKNNGELNQFFIASQIGIEYNYKNKFSVGLMAKKYLTQVQKSSAEFFWQQLLMQVNVPLK